MKSLRDFYSSKEWQIARYQAILNATNDKGQIIDQYSGEVLTNPRKIHVHHKIELTQYNFNDYNISLNQDNLMVVSVKSHNEIHMRFGYQQRKVYIVWGSTCSGKSTYVKDVMGVNDIVLDVDNIWECITNNPRYTKPNGTWDVVRALRDELKQQIKMRSGQWHNAYILTTEARKIPRERLADEVGADELIYIEATKEECYQRLYDDDKRINKEEHIKYIDKFFNQLQL